MHRHDYWGGAQPRYVGDTVSSSGSGFGFVSESCEVDGAGRPKPKAA